MRRRFGGCRGAAVMVALAAPVAVAQEKTPTANGSSGAAASVDPLATQAAIDVMADGGNAFDAAIAAAGVLGVVEPYSCGIGGGGFMVFRDGETRQDLDARLAREVARARWCRARSSSTAGRRPTPSSPSTATAGSRAGVPGTPYAWSHILRNYGTLKLSEALSYGAKVARDGFTVDQTFFDQTTPQRPVLRRHPVDRGALPRRRTARRRTSAPCCATRTLARTYERMGRLGVTKGFYTGPVADAMVKAAHAAAGRRHRRPHLAARPADQPRPRALPDQGRARRSS